MVDARFDIQEGSKCKKSVIFANAQLPTQYGKPVSARDFVFSASVVYAESSGEIKRSLMPLPPQLTTMQNIIEENWLNNLNLKTMHINIVLLYLKPLETHLQQNVLLTKI